MFFALLSNSATYSLTHQQDISLHSSGPSREKKKKANPEGLLHMCNMCMKKMVGLTFGRAQMGPTQPFQHIQMHCFNVDMQIWFMLTFDLLPGSFVSHDITKWTKECSAQPSLTCTSLIYCRVIEQLRSPLKQTV